MTTNVVLPVFVADASLTSDGVDLASFVVDAALAVRQLPDFVADAALDATTQLDLAVPVINNTTVARSLALPQIEPVPDGIRVTLPAVTVDMTEPYGNIDGATLPAIQASITVPFSSATIAAYLGGVIAGVDEDDEPIEIQGTIRVELSDGVISGTIAATLPTVLAVLPAEQYGEIDSTLPRTTASFEAIASTGGEIVGTLAAPTVEMSGGVFEFDTVLPALECFISSTNTSVASITANIPWLESSFTGVVTAFAEISTTLVTLYADVEGVVGQVANIDAVAPAPTISLNGLLGARASLDAALTLIEANIGPAQQVSATISVTLPDFEFSATAYLSVTQVATYVVDTINNAVSTYEAFPFNSFAEINGKYYGAGPAGLFELVGDKDDAITPITSVVSTGHLHFGSEMQKRMSEFFVAMRASGDITLTVTTDEVNSYEYTLSPLDIETLKQRRTLVGKGAKGKYWQFSLTNVDGCDFDFDSFNAAAVVLGRRL